MFEKIVIVDSTGLRPWAVQRLRELVRQVEEYKNIPENNKILIERIGDAEGVLVSYNTRIDREVIEACPAIRYIGMCCTLYSEQSANVDIAAARERGIVVTGIRDYGDEGVVEYVISELVRLLHGFGRQRWREEAYELTGLKVGIVGLGRTGNMIAKGLKFLGAEVYYHNRHRKQEAEQEGMVYLPLDQLLQQVDILGTCLPRNTFVLGKDEFAALGEGKIFFNTSVGPTFDEEALVEWLKGTGNFYMCDQVGMGDLKSYLLSLDNVLLTYRVSGHSAQCMERLSRKVLENFCRYMEIDE